jgi:hypothetical protein
MKGNFDLSLEFENLIEKHIKDEDCKQKKKSFFFSPNFICSKFQIQVEGKILLESAINSNLLLSQSLTQCLIDKLLKSNNLEDSLSIYNLLKLVVARNPRSMYPTSCNLTYITKEKNQKLFYKFFFKMITFLNKSDPSNDLFTLGSTVETPNKRKRNIEQNVPLSQNVKKELKIKKIL